MATLQRRLNRIDAMAIALGSVIGVGVFAGSCLGLMLPSIEISRFPARTT